MKLQQILKLLLGVCFDFDGSKFVSSGDLLFVKSIIYKMSHCEFIQLRKCQRVVFQNRGVCGQANFFSPPLSLLAPSISVTLTSIFASPKSEKCLKRAEKSLEMLATQASYLKPKKC